MGDKPTALLRGGPGVLGVGQEREVPLRVSRKTCSANNSSKSYATEVHSGLTSATIQFGF